MPEKLFPYLFLAGMVLSEVIRAPHRTRHKRLFRQKRIAESRFTALDFALDLTAFAGLQVIPILYVFSSWLDFADYALPTWTSGVGTALLFASLGLLWRAHAKLGESWTPTLQIVPEHELVTTGVYRHIRHPIYAALWLWAVAQPLMLLNWIAGLAGGVAFLPVYLTRVPREEAQLLDHFGDDYRAYMARTGRIIPKPRG